MITRLGVSKKEKTKKIQKITKKNQKQNFFYVGGSFE